MTYTHTKKGQNEKGFTLVELAVVLIIVGLLIGGVLKGQELIGNARVSSTISEIKGIDAATSTFRDAYSAFPGDMSNATTRITGCDTLPNCNNGTGNSRINVDIGADPSTAPTDGGADGEAMNFYGQLAAADLLAGTDGSTTASPGQAFPASALGGGYSVGYNSSSTGNVNNFITDDMRAGTYVILTNNMSQDLAAGDSPITAAQAGRIDRKLDDGVPVTGSVHAADMDNCHATNASGDSAGAYDETDAGATCALAIRIQS